MNHLQAITPPIEPAPAGILLKIDTACRVARATGTVPPRGPRRRAPSPVGRQRHSVRGLTLRRPCRIRGDVDGGCDDSDAASRRRPYQQNASTVWLAASVYCHQRLTKQPMTAFERRRYTRRPT